MSNLEQFQAAIEMMGRQLQEQARLSAERMVTFENLITEQARQTHERMQNLQTILEAQAAQAAAAASGLPRTPAQTPTGATAGDGGHGAQQGQFFPEQRARPAHDGRDPNDARLRRILAGITKMENLDQWG